MSIENIKLKICAFKNHCTDNVYNNEIYCLRHRFCDINDKFKKRWLSFGRSLEDVLLYMEIDSTDKKKL